MTENDQAIDEFWRWFQEHRPDFDKLTDTADPFWDIAVGELKRLNEHLWFELSKPDGEAREFIITAEGHEGAFPIVDKIVARTPNVLGWQFIALKLPMGFDFKTNYEGISFDPRSMWFLPLTNASHPRDFGLRVGVPNFTPRIKRQSESAILVILDTALGERVAAQEIGFVELCALPDRPATAGYIQLRELPKYIEWRKRNLSK